MEDLEILRERNFLICCSLLFNNLGLPKLPLGGQVAYHKL